MCEMVKKTKQNKNIALLYDRPKKLLKRRNTRTVYCRKSSPSCLSLHPHPHLSNVTEGQVTQPAGNYAQRCVDEHHHRQDSGEVISVEHGVLHGNDHARPLEAINRHPENERKSCTLTEKKKEREKEGEKKVRKKMGKGRNERKKERRDETGGGGILLVFQYKI